MCMGPPYLITLPLQRLRVYPHVYGATGIEYWVVNESEGLSPCVWGHPLNNAIKLLPAGSIPMCMGPPGSTHDKRNHIGVYPHVYGATQINSCSQSSD